MENVLEVKNLTKIFFERKNLFQKEPFIAVDSISFSLKKGEILGFLGPNGAGKTTTIQMLLGLMTPSSGQINYFSKDFEKNRSEILKTVSFASAYSRLASRLTIYENLNFFGQLYGIEFNQRRKQIEYYLHFFNLWHIKNRLTGLLSAGQMTRLMLSKAFLINPKIVLLDEPTASLDPEVAQDVRQMILDQQKENRVSILFTSHNMSEIEELCNRILILKNGKIFADNTPYEIASQISDTTIHLMVDPDNQIKLTAYLKEKNIFYSEENQFISFKINENKIAQILSEIATKNINYSQIYIDKPTLEDYFVYIAKKKNDN